MNILIIKISFFIMLICFFPIFLGNLWLINKIKKDELEFLKKNPRILAGYFSVKQNFLWIILLGKYSQLKDPKIKLWCLVIRGFLITDIICFIILTWMIFLSAVIN